MFCRTGQKLSSMKKLYIIRHSKAVENAPDHSDFNRCLADSGIQKATRIAKHLAGQLTTVDLIISSSACRARETASIFATAFHYKQSRILIRDTLYHFGGVDRVLQIIAAVEPLVTNLVVVGHNPTFNALAWHLCDEFREGLPTSAVVGLSFEMDDWEQIIRTRGTLLTYLTRKNLN